MPSIRDRAFCEVALRRSAIAPEQIQQAERTVDELASFGIRRFIGDIIVEKGFAQPDLVQEILDEVKSLSLLCPLCRDPLPLGSCDRQGQLKCPDCGVPVELANGRIPEEDLAATLVRSAGPASQSARARKAGRGKSLRLKKGSFGRPSAGPAESPQEVPRGPKAQLETSAGVRHAALAFPDILPDALSKPPEVTQYEVEALLGLSSSGALYRIRENGGFGALKVLDRALCAEKTRFRLWVEYMQRVQELPRSATLKPTQLHREGAANYVARAYHARKDASLRARLSAHGSLGGRSALDLAVGVLNSLAAFHSMRLIHGNLKPENVILADGAVLLSDPGLYLLLGGLPIQDRVPRLWESSRYHAPEVLQGGDPTFASDVYSVGRIVEDILTAQAPAREGQDPRAAEVGEWLKKVVARMVSADPSERQPSAKDVLRDLEKRPATAPGAKGRLVPFPPLRARSRNVAAHRMLRTSNLGPLFLLLLVLVLCCQGFSWLNMKSALAAPGRNEHVSARLISEEMESLSDWTRHRADDGVAARQRWNDLIELFRGTPWEPPLRSRADRVITRMPQPLEAETRKAIQAARENVEKEEWISALESLMALRGEFAERTEARELRAHILEGLYSQMGMLLIPEGEVEVRDGNVRRMEKVGPFLVDAGLVPRVPAESTIRHADPEIASSAGIQEPLVGINLVEARKLADSSGKRLPTAPEWDRLAALSAAANPWEEFAAIRLRDLRGPTLQWVEEVVEDELSRAGYGQCRGGDRPGLPPTHPVRRRKAQGYPDVGVRFVVDVRPNTPTF